MISEDTRLLIECYVHCLKVPSFYVYVFSKDKHIYEKADSDIISNDLHNYFILNNNTQFNHDQLEKVFLIPTLDFEYKIVQSDEFDSIFLNYANSLSVNLNKEFPADKIKDEFHKRDIDIILKSPKWYLNKFYYFLYFFSNYYFWNYADRNTSVQFKEKLKYLFFLGMFFDKNGYKQNLKKENFLNLKDLSFLFPIIESSLNDNLKFIDEFLEEHNSIKGKFNYKRSDIDNRFSRINFLLLVFLKSPYFTKENYYKLVEAKKFSLHLGLTKDQLNLEGDKYQLVFEWRDELIFKSFQNKNLDILLEVEDIVYEVINGYQYILALFQFMANCSDSELIKIFAKQKKLSSALQSFNYKHYNNESCRQDILNIFHSSSKVNQILMYILFDMVKFNNELLFNFDLIKTSKFSNLLPFFIYIDDYQNKNLLDDYAGGHSGSNKDDDNSGVLNYLELDSVIQSTGDIENTQFILKMLDETNNRNQKVAFLFSSALGLNEKEVLQKIKKRSQLGVKAYGLLPIKTANEVAERYKFIKEFIKQSNEYGQMRTQNEKASGIVGLKNLSYTAGFTSYFIFELEMGKNYFEEINNRKPIKIKDYEITIKLDESPCLEIKCKNEIIKSTPATLKNNDEVEELKSEFKQIKKQIKGLKEEVDINFVNQISFSIKEFQDLFSLQFIKANLKNLVWKNDKGEFAIWDEEANYIVDCVSKKIEITKKMWIAHPYDLLLADKLLPWQKFLYAKKICQPFKQVFREIYIVTPAEEKAENFSNRFFGFSMKGNVLNGLCKNRAWSFVVYEGCIFKRFYQEKIVVKYSLQECGHYLSEMPVVGGQVTFHHIHYQNQKLLLKEVPPNIFSESMRDIDLFVSIARMNFLDDQNYSTEMFSKIGEVIFGLMDILRINNVKIDGHFAYVDGKKANYRVHLVSGNIHIMPGAYLCIVPDNMLKTNRNIFIPFENEENDTLTLILSKILLLVNDHKITDPSILSQIEKNIN